MITSIRICLRILCVILIFSSGFRLPAQEGQTCAEKLKAAQSLFAKGQVEQIPSLLSECLKSGFKKEEQLTAFKLLIQTYLLNDKTAQADSTMMVFLRRNPEYQESPTDHSSFVYLFRTYSVRPVLQLGVRIGSNLPFLTFVQENPLSGKPGASEFNTELANLFLSVETKFRVAKKLELGVGAGYSQVKFQNIVDFLNFGVVSYSESQQRLEIPVSVTWDITNWGKFTPFLRGGIGSAINLSTSADIIQESKDNSPDITGETLSRRESRIPADLFVQAGGGMKFKIPHGYLFTELRSNFGIMQQNVPGTEQIGFIQGKYKWTDPGFRLNTFNMNLGYTYIFYKSTKRRNP